MRNAMLVVLLSLLGLPVQAMDMKFRGFDSVSPPIDASLARLQDQSGATIRIENWQGKWVLLNLWATWCAPCVAELPTLNTLAGGHGIEDLEVIGVSVDAGAKPGKIKKFLERHNVGSFAGYLDSDAALQSRFEATGLPMTYLLDPAGKAVAQYRGATDWSDPKVVQGLKRLMSSGKTENKSPTKP